MKRIIGMLMAVCICFGLCMQTNVSEAARWQTYYTGAWGEQCQIDLDSVQKVGKDTYRFWERSLHSDGEVSMQGFYECNIAAEAGYGYGTERRLAWVDENGRVRYESGGETFPVFADSDHEVNRVVYLNHKYGDGKAQLPNWIWFYSSDTTTCKIDMSTISKKNGVYSAWVQEYTPLTAAEEAEIEHYEAYMHKRFDYKQDKQGRLWGRLCAVRNTGGVAWNPMEWTPIKECWFAENAEREFQFLKAHLG